MSVESLCLLLSSAATPSAISDSNLLPSVQSSSLVNLLCETWSVGSDEMMV